MTETRMDPKKKELIDGLNEDLSWEYAAVMTYRSYASLVQGPYRQELRQFFEAEIPDELAHAQMLADKIVALGGMPSVKPAPVKLFSEAKAMLQNALEDERSTLARYIKRRKLAEELGEHGLAVELDTLIADESKHADELQLMLGRWDD